MKLKQVYGTIPTSRLTCSSSKNKRKNENLCEILHNTAYILFDFGN